MSESNHSIAKYWHDYLLLLNNQNIVKKEKASSQDGQEYGTYGCFFCFALFCFYLYFSDQLYLLQSAHSFRTSPHLIPLVVLQIAIAFPL